MPTYLDLVTFLFKQSKIYQAQRTVKKKSLEGVREPSNEKLAKIKWRAKDEISVVI